MASSNNEVRGNASPPEAVAVAVEVAVEVEANAMARQQEYCAGLFLGELLMVKVILMWCGILHERNTPRLSEPCPLHRLFRYFAIPTLCTFCIGCAGFRGGWESVAYVGDMPSSAAPAGLRSSLRADRPELNLPGVKLHVSIDNQLRTYDTQIIFGLPLSVDPRIVYPKNHKLGKTRVFVNVVPQTDGFVFQPLVIDGKWYQAMRGSHFGLWDKGQLVESGGRWEHRDVGAEFALTSPSRPRNRTELCSICRVR